MVAVSIAGCCILILILFFLTTFFKGISSFIDAMIDMADIWVILALGGLAILALELVVAVFADGFWSGLLLIVGIGIGIAIFGSILGAIGSIFVLVFEIGFYIFTTVFGIAVGITEQLGEWSESGLKFFLGRLNGQILKS